MSQTKETSENKSKTLVHKFVHVVWTILCMIVLVHNCMFPVISAVYKPCLVFVHFSTLGSFQAVHYITFGCDHNRCEFPK